MKALEVAKSFYACISIGDLHGVLDLMDDKISWKLHGPDIIPYCGTYEGKAGVELFFKRLFENEDVIEFQPLRFIDGGDDIAVIGKERCRSKQSGSEFSVQWAQVFEIRADKIVSWSEFIDTYAMAEAYRK